MRIGILGTGVVGQTLGGKLAELGHDVMIGTRDVEKTLASKEKNAMGMPPFAEWQKDHQQVRLGTFAEAAAHGEAAINATSGGVSLNALRMAGERGLAGKVLIDAANPLDFSKGMPPTLTVCNTDSVGEQIQAAFPQAKVVKALNTITAGLMIDPKKVNGGDHTLFICGNDAGAKAQVKGWLQEWFGWRDILDLGDISNARGMEMYLPLWLRMWGATGTGMINVKVVK
jgi:predicted dinucleotide-binding enzyme